ncbi:TonB-dependent receptor [Psychrosphaera saromensis]|uniref:TonB-dependent receptor n=1 Tax=Psychrosphaera saromensis TaxID=716813 RepID=A0A2S7UVJ5_9GAMM|nr:TonB-dependent receptor [Psychrosphaera saromensis]PQJ53745.1 TonB-dependent receptor [Psychrosphaera saromensis]GHB62648.1 TonB-dependent receptor [Psychrosphaera saromensis]GLQ15471.1 TonB-dependent receptor [Psychrosphaera saromensis]
MSQSSPTFTLSAMTLAIVSSLTPMSSYAVEDEKSSETEDYIEEVVATGTRLKGSAAAVIEERRNQAFVADIMGAEQISRSGDGDAAAALRRVTGLTLVDGKFIYVRGLGERYSSTQLNGAAVPSPDPTRSVIPLDLFPAEIIEGLSVQKSFSPSMPAAFGGGNVDIRLKSIPDSRVFNFSAKLGGNTNNFDQGLTTTGSDTDWLGQDDGSRDAPASITQYWAGIGESSKSLDYLSGSQSLEGLVDLNRDLTPKTASINPNVGFDLAFGDVFDYGNVEYGFLTTLAYDNAWQVAEEYQMDQWSSIDTDEGRKYTFIRGYDDILSTSHTVKTSYMINLGANYNKAHELSLNYIVLNDTEDKAKDKFGISNNVSPSENNAILNVKETSYEERSLTALQVSGQHTFTDLNLLGFDWIYSDSESNRYAPSGLSTNYIIADRNNDGIYDSETESSLRLGSTAARFNFQDLVDDVEHFSFNASLPIYLSNLEMEFKVGASFVDKTREADNRRFDLDTRALATGFDLTGNDINQILSDDKLTGVALSRSVLNDTTIDGDLYTAAQSIDAYYAEADFFINNRYRISGGVRFEDFSQTALPYDPFTGEVDLTKDQTSISDLTFTDDGIYPALALTYILNDEMQFRASFGQTVVRPDLREISAATYIDPLTEYPVSGTPGLKTTDMTNIDLRWEWYMPAGNNISVGLFTKSLDNPIEAVQSPAQDGPALIRMANGEDGYVKGIEFEFLQDLNILKGVLGSFGENSFISGNVTLSDSEITLDRQNIVDQTGVSTSITNLERRLTGHSEYVVNMQLGYDSSNGEHLATVVYNVFGERVIVAGIEGFEDAMEQPFHSLDVNYTYFPTFSSQVKFKLTNILDEKKEITFDDELLRSSTKGVGFSVSYKVEF